MCETIRLYIDEVKEIKSCFIHACLFTDPSTCEKFESDITRLKEDNRNILGKEFKGFHARNLNGSNWNKLSPIYESLIYLMFANSIGIHIYLESKEKHDKNSKILKNWLKSNLESKDDTNKVKLAFKDLKSEDYPVLYHRSETLYISLIHKDKYGKNCKFEIYPDSSGKVLSYKENTIEFTSSNQISKTFNFYSSFEILANALIETFDQIGYLPNNNQKVIKFSPTNDSDSFLIQGCDIIANFLFHYIRYNSGIIDNNSKLKSTLFSKYFLIDEGDEFVKKNFGIIENELFCINPNMKKSINPSS